MNAMNSPGRAVCLPQNGCIRDSQQDHLELEFISREPSQPNAIRCRPTTPYRPSYAPTRGLFVLARERLTPFSSMQSRSAVCTRS
jgi:hypothetical protein